MKSIHTLIIFCIFSSSIVAQDYEPTILILAPDKSQVDAKLQDELKEANAALQKTSQRPEPTPNTESNERTNMPENIRMITDSETAYSKEMNFFKVTSLIAQQYLSYRFYERFPNLLVLLSENTSAGNRTELKMLADNAKTQYVLNFPSISLFKRKGTAYADLRVQLFDNATGDYLIDTTFTGDWDNPGFEFSCKDHSLSCTINNALSQALTKVTQMVVDNSPTVQRESRLMHERYEELISTHFTKPINLELVKKVLRNEDDVSADNIFQVLYDGTNTKFVAFSLEQVAAQDFKKLTDNKKDRSVNVILDKSIKDADFLSSVPQNYAYIISGVKFEGEWYYEKSNVTYFEASSVDEAREMYFNNLQKLNFFMENSTMVSPSFWESALFEKVPDLKKHPDWDKYGETIWKTREANNRDYIGMYEIVANAKRRKRQEESDRFEKQMMEGIFRPFYERLKKTQSETWATYSDQSPIYSKVKDVVISPVLVANRKGVKTLHYFVAFSKGNEIFEWTYFPVTEVKSAGAFGPTVVDHLETVTEWNFAYDTLDDAEFWKKCVLRTEDDSFTYLRKVD